MAVERSNPVRCTFLRMLALLGAAIFLCTVSACQDLTGNPPLPAGVQSPEVYSTPQGALQQSKGALRLLRSALMVAVQYTGMFTDELTLVATSLASSTVEGRIDMRISEDQSSPNSPYSLLQDARGHASLARKALAMYAPHESLEMRGLMYAVEGYAEILLADLYCSGIPLSILNLPAGFAYAKSSSTLEVYAHAAALFDTALTFTAGKDSIDALARIGFGRALVGLGLFDSAARVVASVPSTAVFRVRRMYRRIDPFMGGFTVSDREGQNGLPYLSSEDPRTRSTLVTVNEGRDNMYTAFVPTKYLDVQANDSTTMVLASGVEARLIEAEADLARGGTDWLTRLNALRTNGVMTITPRTDVPGVSPGPVGHPDTSWGAGEGNVLLAPSIVADTKPTCPRNVPCTDTSWFRGIRPLQDPGEGLSPDAAKVARLDLLFSERANWLFLSGARQGDLRRLIRQYGKGPETVYSTGVYGNLQGMYGNAVVLPIPSDEYRNPYYRGCLNHGA